MKTKKILIIGTLIILSLVFLLPKVFAVCYDGNGMIDPGCTFWLKPVTSLSLSPTSVPVNQYVTATWSSTQAATGCTGIIDNPNGSGTTNYSLPASGSNSYLAWTV